MSTSFASDLTWLVHVQVGWFLHTPFPSSEIYRTLPVREEVLRAVLKADLIGFHTYDYARHFVSACTRILGLEVSTSADSPCSLQPHIPFIKPLLVGSCQVLGPLIGRTPGMHWAVGTGYSPSWGVMCMSMLRSLQLRFRSVQVQSLCPGRSASVQSTSPCCEGVIPPNRQW